VAFDGTNIWVTNGGPGTVTKLLASTGAIVGTYGVGYNPQGVAFDGTNIWVACTGSVTKLLASTGAIAATYNNFYAPYGIAFDGSNMWVADASTGTVTKISPSAQ
jgi:DNA-binding beta-propeller fold protein YncE